MGSSMELPYMAAILWSWVGVWFLSALKSVVPPDFFRMVDDFKRQVLRKWSLYYEFDVPECSGASYNDLYRSVHLYISSRSLDADAECLIVERPKNAIKVQFELGRNQFMRDEFRGQRVRWERRANQDKMQREERSYRLVVPRSVKSQVPEYFEFLLEEGKRLENLRGRGNKKLYSNLDGRYWTSAIFNPPATFDTLAMEPEVKQSLIQDLTKFLNGEKFYKAVGRAWKRGYLLHGPPGTGKSSLIAAMANFTGYDVYDLELTRVSSNTRLRELLSMMTNRVIVVVEDIDCSVDFKKRKVNVEAAPEAPDEEEEEYEDPNPRQKNNTGSGITLSGLLNFADGIWSSTGSERIFVFTTNCIEKLDAALLRPGRMDMHICLSYCSFAVFRELATTYLGLDPAEEEHELFPEIKRLLAVVNVTPAQMIEMILRADSDIDSALKTVVASLQELHQKVESQVSISEDDAPAFEDGAASE